MSNQTFEKPFLKAPYDFPGRHGKLGATVQPSHSAAKVINHLVGEVTKVLGVP
jgi:hypothetical protein